ncbi:YveK family protein [Lacticaseibacillus paracasei]|uniref:YveK family protein n=1 Tax=Lacticaseibacillus paracasei TaxID=1597 RepID=UPI0028DE8629|nr:Wzz/FepE/Etk N-terminal domain-containing protein [Lacticaseibacillus paracasei]MDT8951844.1 Wzz/FepE/Etk N-terminal domain-containing protein [Lacticaseibacillus paracasei subsp. paracasei]
MTEQINLSQLWNVLKRSFIAMIIVGFFGMLIAYFGTKTLVSPKYEASTSLLVNRKQDNNANMQLNAQQADIQIINTYKDIILRPVVLRAVADDLTSPRKIVTKKAKKAVYDTRYNSVTGLSERYIVEPAQPTKYKLEPAKYNNLTDTDLSKMVSVTNTQNSQVFTVDVRDTSPTRAKDIANSIAKVFKEKIATIMSVSNVSIVSKATTDTTPVAPRLKLIAAIGAIIGMIIAFVWGLIRELTDQTIKDIDFITDNLGLVNLGIVNYVQQMKDLDETIKESKSDRSDFPEDMTQNEFPQRSRRRI